MDLSNWFVFKNKKKSKCVFYVVVYTNKYYFLRSKVSEDTKRRMRSLLGIHNEGGNGKYLGLPEQFGRKKSEMFQYIINKVKAATQGWNKKFLSHGGKEVLLKAVALAMPIFSMNVFRLPRDICDEINSILAKFWWGSGDKKECIGIAGKECRYQREKGDWDLEI